MDSSGFVKDGWQAGLWKITPSSVTGGTIGSNGDVTVGTAVASIILNGVFSSDYAVYKVTWTGGSCSDAADQEIRIQIGNATTGYYSAIYGTTSANAFSGSYRNNTVAYFDWCGRIGPSGTAKNNMDVTISGPQTATYTQITGNYPVYSGGNLHHMMGTLENTTSYTSMTITIDASATATGGIIRVYGYN